MVSRRKWIRALAAGILMLTLVLLGGAAEAISLAICRADSQMGAIIQSAPCGIYGVVQTRTEAAGPIYVRYMTHTPAGAPKGIVFLLPGGAGARGSPARPASRL